MSARLTLEDRQLRAISEAQWQHQVEQIARLHDWRLFHAPDNRPVTARSGRRYVQNIRAGFPDLVLVRGPRLLFAELKRETGRLSDEQHAWLNDLARASAEVYVWRPSDLSEVHAVLSRRSDR